MEVYPSLSSGRPVTLTHPFSDRYPAGGPNALADGLKGSRDFKDGFWQGYEGTDLEAIIDLGQARTDQPPELAVHAGYPDVDLLPAVCRICRFQ